MQQHERIFSCFARHEHIFDLLYSISQSWQTTESLGFGSLFVPIRNPVWCFRGDLCRCFYSTMDADFSKPEYVWSLHNSSIISCCNTQSHRPPLHTDIFRRCNYWNLFSIVANRVILKGFVAICVQYSAPYTSRNNKDFIGRSKAPKHLDVAWHNDCFSRSPADIKFVSPVRKSRNLVFNCQLGCFHLGISNLHRIYCRRI